MPRPLGVLLIAAASILCGVFAWFCLVWLLSAAANVTGVRALDVALFIVSPHMGGWLVAFGLGVVAFVLGIWLARTRGPAWLGFAVDPAIGTDSNRRNSGPVNGPG